MKKAKGKPLFTLNKPVKAEVYRSKFRAFESTKYLNVAALKKAKRAVIESGSIEAPRMSATVAAEIRRGVITKITPVACRNCGNHKRTGKGSKSTVKRVAAEAVQRVRGLRLPVFELPKSFSSAREIDIPIGPIVIVIFTDPIDLCILIDEAGGGWCLWCLFGGSVCGGVL